MGTCPKCGSSAAPDQPTCAVCGAALEPRSGAAAPAEGVPPSLTPPPRTSGALPGQRPTRAAPPTRRARGRGIRSVVPIFVALALTLLFQQLLGSAVSPDAYLYRLFRPPGGWLMGIVPGLILFVFIWTITDLVLKHGVTRKNERDLERPDIKQLPTVVSGEPASASLDRLRGLERDFVSRPVGQRVHWILRHLVTDEDLQRTHELLRHHADLDADGAASGYRTVTLFIWAMPILGFIGTVLGISLAVGGFSDFLTTSVSIDEIDRVTAELGNVASGLSFAFDTTLLGLLAGLLASVASSAVQKREERFLTGLDELGLQIMANSRPATASAPSAPASAAAVEDVRRILARLDDMSGRLDHFTESMRSGVDNLNQASARLDEGLATSIGSASSAVQSLGASMKGTSDSLTDNVAALAEKLTASERHLQEGLTGLREAMDRSGQRDAAGQEAIMDLSQSIAELGQRIADFKKAQDSLSPALNRLAGPLELRLTPARPADGDRE